VLCFLMLPACALPSLPQRSPSAAIENTADTRLGRAVARVTTVHAGLSGVYALPGDRDAFAARALLAAAAERSIDAQYYIWQGDRSGNLLLEELWRAAERGVRVRLLIDDDNTAGRDSVLAALSAHMNVEVRLFNPMAHRHARWLNFALDFKRVNHRMHNKSFTVDNQVTIVGGRNVGDEYFDAGSPMAYDDLDVMAVGPIVRQVSAEFDLYWNSALAYPAEALLRTAPPGSAEEMEETFARTRADPVSDQYQEVLRQTRLIKDLSAGQLPFEWSHVGLVFDDPDKALDLKDSEQLLLLTRLIAMTARPTVRFDLVSPYFVPRKQGARLLEDLAGRGVSVRILTNSLESTDVIEVHAAYSKYRKALLAAGVRLYELERKERPVTRVERTTGVRSASGLHAKSFDIDGKVLFVGSFNFDPRSARLNTEMGLLIDSPVLASRLASFFAEQVSSVAYVLSLTAHHDIRWSQRTSAGQTIFNTEPHTSVGRRAKSRFLSILPIEWLL